MFNYYFDIERDLHPDTVKLFEEIKAGKYQAFTSEYTIDELSRAPKEKFHKMMKLIEEYNITVFQLSDEADKLGALYQEQGILPRKSTTDACHIAIATINDIDMILSLNFEHIVRKKTVLMTGNLNTQLGYKPVDIRSPMEVVERENP
jgi:predicted nucleic acid-binding protein